MNNFAFKKINFIMIGLSMVLVIIGFVMMTGASSTEKSFAPEIFSASRISVAPMICLVGFVSIIAAIMYRPKEDKK